MKHRVTGLPVVDAGNKVSTVQWNVVEGVTGGMMVRG